MTFTGSQVHKTIGPRQVGPISMSAEDCADYMALGDTGIAVPRRAIHPDAAVFRAQDDSVVAQHACARLG